MTQRLVARGNFLYSDGKDKSAALWLNLSKPGRRYRIILCHKLSF